VEASSSQLLLVRIKLIHGLNGVHYDEFGLFLEHLLERREIFIETRLWVSSEPNALSPGLLIQILEGSMKEELLLWDFVDDLVRKMLEHHGRLAPV